MRGAKREPDGSSTLCVRAKVPSLTARPLIVATASPVEAAIDINLPAPKDGESSRSTRVVAHRSTARAWSPCEARREALGSWHVVDAMAAS